MTATKTAPKTSKVKSNESVKPLTMRDAKKEKDAPVKKDTAPKEKGDKSKRLRMFEYINAAPNGACNTEIRTALVVDGIAKLCRDEVMHGRMKVMLPEPGDRGMRFTLTAKGRKAIDKGTVDSDAAPKSSWEE